MKQAKKGKKAQGLPMYAIGIIIIGIIVVALVLIFIFGVSGEGTGILEKVFSSQGEVANEASKSVSELTGNLFRK